MDKRENKGRIGSSFDDFLDKEGILEDVQRSALKEIALDQAARDAKGKRGKPWPN